MFSGSVCIWAELKNMTTIRDPTITIATINIEKRGSVEIADKIFSRFFIPIIMIVVITITIEAYMNASTKNA
jgi:hypothetical protein